jgi:ABC-type tungstate transport system permease subunit
MKLRLIVPLVLTALLAHASLAAEPTAPETITLASTTSVDNSGLLAAILPTFTKESGITVHVLAQGTGQALATAARDAADLVLVHDPEAEERFIADGHGIERAQIAWNDFVVVGPRSDPAHIGVTSRFAQNCTLPGHADEPLPLGAILKEGSERKSKKIPKIYRLRPRTGANGHF